MKAVVFHEHGGPERLIYKDVSPPEIGADEVLVRVKACALNHLDIWVREGIPAYKTRLPHISGCDIVGVVEDKGTAASGIATGERVLISPGLSCFRCEMCLAGQDNLCLNYTIIGAGPDGGYAEYVKAPTSSLITLPEALSFEQGAAYPLTFLTAWHMLITRAQIRAGQEVLVLAAGSGIGSAAIQIAKLAGARVLATAGTEEKLERARELGADEVIHSIKEDFAKRARDLTQGRGVDVVFEHVGPETWKGSIHSLAKGGTLVTCGATTGPEVKLDLRFLFSRQLALLGSMMGTRRELIEVTRLVGQGKLKPIIDRCYPLREAREAQERMLLRQHFGKILLLP